MDAMTICDMCPTCNHKKAGRKLKYTNDEDRKRAKQEQTNKCLQRIYEKKREQAMQKKEEKEENTFQFPDAILMLLMVLT